MLFKVFLKTIVMKWIFSFLAIAILSCNNGGENNNVNSNVPDRAIRDSIKDPAVTNPPADAIPEDMTIVKDSLIKPKDSVTNQP